MAQNAASEPAHCEWCPQDWDCSPELLVPCPTGGCNAKPGHPCMRPSGHTAWTFHPTRQQAALRAGMIDRAICRGLCLPTEAAARAREAVIARLRQQFPGQERVPWEATYAAVASVVSQPLLNSTPQVSKKAVTRTTAYTQSKLFG